MLYFRFKVFQFLFFFLMVAYAHGQCSVTATVKSVSCFGGSDGEATASGTGGTAPYTYSWNTSPIQTTATATGLAAGTYTVTVKDSAATICTVTAQVTITQPAALTATTIQNSPVKCNGEANGSAKVTAFGGTLPYTYDWGLSSTSKLDTATDLGAGLHTVTITDKNGCKLPATVTITEPALLIASAIENSPVKCNGDSNGKATVTASGGTGPYTYSWDKSTSTSAIALDLPVGLHTVIVTDFNGCKATALVTITEPALLNASAVQNSQVKCTGEFNGVATVTVTGGTTPYSFSWDKSTATGATATNLGAGLHTVTITDKNGCKIAATVTITEPTLLAAAANQTSPVKCKGESDGTASVTVTGGTTPYMFTWDKSNSTIATASDLQAGLHTITIRDANACEIKAFVTITEPTIILSATAIQNSSVKCFGGSDGSATVTASGGTAPYSYIWENSASTTTTATDLAAGVHNITIRDANGCETATIVLINEPTVLKATAAQFKSVVCNGAANGSATVTAIGGTLPYSYSWDKSSSVSAVASDLAAGIHTVTVKDKNGCEIKANVEITEPADLTVTVIQNSPVKCKGAFNGSATITVAGGTTPYTYVWQNSASTTNTATDLRAGTHNITVRDANGCAKIISVVITEPAVLEVAAVQNSPVKCNGGLDGSATVTVIGGTIPYTYYWDNKAASGATATDLAVGTHSVKVIDANGCEATTTVTITGPIVLSATAQEVSPVKCKGALTGVAKVTPLGGTGPYTYDWGLSSTSTSDTATDLAAGSHTITIYDANACSATTTVTITELNVLDPSVVQLIAVSCFGGADGSARVTVTGGKGPYAFYWDGNTTATSATAVNLTAGTHTVKVVDANLCEITVSVLITQPVVLSANATQDSPVKCKGENNGVATVTTVGGTIPYTYSWDKSTSTSATATNLPAGLHTITIRDKNNCVATVSILITEPDILALTQNVQPITCNSGGSITVQVTGGVSTNYFYDWTGPASFSRSGANLRSITNLTNGGTYKLTVTDDNGCKMNKDFTLEAYVPLEYTGPTAIEFDTCNNNPTFGIAISDIRGGIPYRDSNGNPYYYFEWFGPNNYHSNEAIIPIGPGNYVGIISDSVNCKSSPITFTVTTPYTPIVVNNIIGNVSCDSGSADGYIAVSVNGGKIPYSILWEREIPSTTPGNPNPTYSVIGQNILRVNNLTEGRYRLTVTSNLFNCSDSNPAYKFQTVYTVNSQNSIRILEAPVLDVNLCAGKTGTLKIKVIDDNNGPVSFYYNGVLANAEALGGNYYTVHIANFVADGVLNTVNEFGCGETVTIDIRVAEPSFEISSVGYNINGIININEQVTFRNTSTPPYSRLEWNFGDNTALSEEESPTHTYAVSGIRDVTLRIYNDLGCYKEFTEKISVGKGYLAMFPDVFTPNNDGLNDYFEGELIGFTSFEFEIYDLWNNLLFSTATNVTNASNWGWNGNLRDGTPFNGKIFKYVFKGIDNFGKEVIVSNQALLLR